MTSEKAVNNGRAENFLMRVHEKTVSGNVIVVRMLGNLLHNCRSSNAERQHGSIRYRDSMEQDRIAISDLHKIIDEQVNMKNLFKKIVAE